MFKLRPYQQEAVDLSIDFFRSVGKEKPILVLPTGSGKSLIIGSIAKHLKKEVLVLQPSVELLHQNYAKYQDAITGHPDLEPASIYSASVGSKERGKVTFATIGSIYRNPELFEGIEYVLIDECQNVPPDKTSMYVTFMTHHFLAKVVGLTATPYRLKTYTDPWTQKKFSKINLLIRELPKFFNKFLYIVQPKQMYDEGFLCPVNYIEMKFDGTFLEFNSTGAEYSDKSIKEAMERNKIIEKIPGILDQAFKKGQHACLVFVRAVEEARHLAEITPFSAYIHALTDKKERAAIIKSFKNGSIKTVFNVGILTTGFDYPKLDTIIIARPTMSLGLYVQMIGRGIRKAEGKEKCSVVDMAGNLARFGKIEDLRIENDIEHGWVLRNNEKILSGRRLDELV